MLGLGETRDEVVETMRELRDADVDVLTLGQYLRPTSRHLAVVEYVTPADFEWYANHADDIPFVFSATAALADPAATATTSRSRRR